MSLVSRLRCLFTVTPPGCRGYKNRTGIRPAPPHTPQVFPHTRVAMGGGLELGASGELELGAQPSPVQGLHQQLNAARRQLVADLVRQLTSSASGDSAQRVLSPATFCTLTQVQDTQRQLMTVEAVHSRFSALVAFARKHVPVSLEDDLRPDDLRLLRLAEDCWRPLGLGKAFANWMSHVVDAYVRARLRELVSRVSAIVTVHHLLLRWLQWCVFAQERQDRRLAAEHVERNRMMRAALQACRQWCGRQHEKRAAELIEWKCTLRAAIQVCRLWCDFAQERKHRMLAAERIERKRLLRSALHFWRLPREPLIDPNDLVLTWCWSTATRANLKEAPQINELALAVAVRGSSSERELESTGEGEERRFDRIRALIPSLEALALVDPTGALEEIAELTDDDAVALQATLDGGDDKSPNGKWLEWRVFGRNPIRTGPGLSQR